MPVGLAIVSQDALLDAIQLAPAGELPTVRIPVPAPARIAAVAGESVYSGAFCVSRNFAFPMVTVAVRICAAVFAVY